MTALTGSGKSLTVLEACTLEEKPIAHTNYQHYGTI